MGGSKGDVRNIVLLRARSGFLARLLESDCQTVKSCLEPDRIRQFILLAIGFAISRFHGRIRGVGVMEHRIDGNGCILYMEGMRPCGDDDQ